jgi:hypothetical protein
LGEEPTGEKNEKFLEGRDDLLSSTDEDSFQLTEVADQSGGHALGSQILEALIQMNCFFPAKETIDNSKYP